MLKKILDLLKIPENIKTLISLGALAIISIIIINYMVQENIKVAMSFFAIISIVYLICSAESKRGTPLKEDIRETANLSKDLRVEEGIWKKIDTLLKNLGFYETKRNDSEELINEPYEFSLAKGSTSLFIVQLKREELTLPVVSLLIAMKNELESTRGSKIGKIVIICNVQQIYDALYHYINGKKDLALLTNYSIKKLGESDAGIIHLEEKLALKGK